MKHEEQGVGQMQNMLHNATLRELMHRRPLDGGSQLDLSSYS